MGIEERVDGRGVVRYRGKVYDKRARRHRSGPWTDRLAEARGWRTDAQAALKMGTLPADSGPMLRVALERFFNGMRSGQVRNRSGRIYKPSVCRLYASSYRLYVDRELGPIRVTDLRRVDIQSMVDRLSMTHGASTVRNALMPLRAYYRWGLARGLVPMNPTTGLEVPAVDGRRDRIAAPSEVADLVAILPEGDRPLWATLFYAGLRMGEARALKIEDIDLNEGVIWVRCSWDSHAGSVEPKSAAGNRSVPIPKVLKAYLAPHLENRAWVKGLAFGRSADAPFSPQTMTQRADRIWRKAGLARITPHEARHTYASMMIEAMKRDRAVNPKLLARLMGHASIATTFDRYGHLLPQGEAVAGAALDDLLSVDG